MVQEHIQHFSGQVNCVFSAPVLPVQIQWEQLSTSGSSHAAHTKPLLVAMYVVF